MSQQHKNTRAHRISMYLMEAIRESADRNDRTFRAQIERYIRAGMEALEDTDG